MSFIFIYKSKVANVITCSHRSTFQAHASQIHRFKLKMGMLCMDLYNKLVELSSYFTDKPYWHSCLTDFLPDIHIDTVIKKDGLFRQKTEEFK